MTETEIKGILDQYDKVHKKNESYKGKIVEYAFRSLLGILVWLGVSTYSSLNSVREDVSILITQRTYAEKDILKNTLAIEKKDLEIRNNKDAIIKLTQQIEELKIK